MLGEFFIERKISRRKILREKFQVLHWVNLSVLYEISLSCFLSTDSILGVGMLRVIVQGKSSQKLIVQGKNYP